MNTIAFPTCRTCFMIGLIRRCEMGLFNWIRETMTGQRVCPIEHLESFKRVGEQVYALHVEMADCEAPRALAYLQAARSLQTMADALLGDAFSNFGNAPKPVPIITHEQAEVWYGKLPAIMIAARQEALFEQSSAIELPIRLGQQMEGPSPCPVEHLSGLRRAAERMDEMTSQGVAAARNQGDTYKAVLLLYESARTRKQAGDAIVGSITSGRRVSPESHEDAEKQYWIALSEYLLIAQGLKAPFLFKSQPPIPSSASFARKLCKLDSDDIWKVTSSYAKRDIRRAGEWEQAIEDLREHWATCLITDIEREYETTVEQLLEKDLIEETRYWYCCPFPSVYRVRSSCSSVQILGAAIPRGHEFVYEYGDDGAEGKFISAPSFNRGAERKYCEDN
ncbi:hypothetical protein [Cohnella nanjingensis]|uniref:Uncharacterized protein n=1 Tax=Cohnella nanjingensis TaxID=1387779 RepID=A0A7X0RLJ1_9BACL|nr:hypothetical protein [Cohnella nanjingensis]MBB6669508.1 hypothetical protein [Cohnella nanjingensis]